MDRDVSERRLAYMTAVARIAAIATVAGLRFGSSVE